MSKKYIQALLITLAVGVSMGNISVEATAYHCGQRQHLCLGDKPNQKAIGCKAFSDVKVYGKDRPVPAGAFDVCSTKGACILGQSYQAGCAAARHYCDYLDLGLAKIGQCGGGHK